MSNKKSQYVFQTKVRKYGGTKHPAASIDYREMPLAVKFMASGLLVLYVVVCAVIFAATVMLFFMTGR